MLRIAIALFLGLSLAGPADAQARERRALEPEEEAVFHGVGRLNVGGTRFCTAALIAERLVITAAHCLYHPRSFEPVPIDELRFVAGQDGEAMVAVRRASRAAVPADFVFDGRPSFEHLRRDIALVELDAPITSAEAPAYPVGATPPPEAVIEIVSYVRGRSRRASLQDGCRIDALIGQVAALDCGVNLGASGAPVFAVGKGGRWLWGVVSSTGTLMTGGEVTLAIRVEPELAGLEAMLEPRIPARDAPAGSGGR
jgi:hypothetical protein